MESLTGITTTAVDDDSYDDVSDAVVTAVAETKGVDPLELEPLYSVVDPDALNSLVDPVVGPSPSSLEVSFSMAGCDVVVSSDGSVVVTQRVEAEPQTAIVSHDD